MVGPYLPGTHYGYSPSLGSGEHAPSLSDVRDFFFSRPNTILPRIDRLADGMISMGIAPVQVFLETLRNDPATYRRPVGDILIGTHGSNWGWMELPLVKGQTGPILIDHLMSMDSSILGNLVNDLMDPDPTRRTVHIRACNLGKLPEFVSGIKRAFGGQVSVIAPKHYYHLTKYEEHGWFEYLRYRFTIWRPQRLATKALIKEAFHEDMRVSPARFAYIDSTAVGTTEMDAWIDAALGSTDVSLVTGDRDFRIEPSVRPLALAVDKRKTLPTVALFAIESHPYFFNDFLPTSAPTSEDDLKRQLKDRLPRSPAFSTRRPTQQAIFGYDSVASFVDGFRWTWQSSPTAGRLMVTGTRAIYTLIIPILDNKSQGNVMANYQPFGGGTGVRSFADNDPRFFLTV